jgi:4-amino-4-deoxy-L-arabinose transferase-like glycosyltransferase
MSRFWRVMLIVLGAALLLRVGYVLTVTQHDDNFYDATFYELQARSLANGDGFEDVVPFTHGPNADHPPLTSIVLAPAALAPGDDDSDRLLMRFEMVLVGLAVVVLVGLLGRAVAGERAGLLAAAIAAVYPNLWMNDGLLMSETLAALATTAVLLLAYRVVRERSIGMSLALGAVCGLAALVRAELALLVVLVAVPAIWVSTREDAADRWKGIGAALGAAAVVVAPWVGFNLARFEEPTFLSTGDGPVLIGANCDDTYGGDNVGLWLISCFPEESPPGDQSEVSRRLRDDAWQYIQDHPADLPVVAAARLGRLVALYDPVGTVEYSEGEGRPAWASWLGLATFLVLVALAVVGGRALRRRSVRIWPLLAPVWLVLVSAVIFYGLPRFRVPLEPTVVVLGAVGIAALLARRQAEWLPEAAPPTSASPTSAPSPSTIEASSSS